MQNDSIYALTGRGQNELRSGVTTLSPPELELLVRIDGVLSIGQIKAGMPTMTGDTFASTFQRLLDRYLVTVAEVDPFAEQFDSQLSQLDLSLAEAEADAGAKSLRKAGYYVSIARKRGPSRPLAPGELLSAIVVEDEPMLAKFIQSYLAFEGFRVRLAGNRAEVVAEFRKAPIPNLILLDVMLPDADGFDILLRLRQHPALKHVPIIMLTGKATREAVIKGLASGADGYVTKPFEADALMRAVRTVVGLPDEPVAPGKPNDPWINRDAKP
jgi:two-component system OmpR family response regulator